MNNLRLGLSLLGAITLLTAFPGFSHAQTDSVQRVETNLDRSPLPKDKKGRVYASLADLDSRPSDVRAQSPRSLVEEPKGATYRK